MSELARRAPDFANAFVQRSDGASAAAFLGWSYDVTDEFANDTALVLFDYLIGMRRSIRLPVDVNPMSA